jgi:hypothetical protein
MYHRWSKLKGKPKSVVYAALQTKIIEPHSKKRPGDLMGNQSVDSDVNMMSTFIR